jgi:predicted CopG family antitoxin
MGVKNISIKEKVYRLLKQSKKNNESFSDVIEKALTHRPVDLKDYFGLLKDSAALDDIEKHIAQLRESARVRV